MRGKDSWKRNLLWYFGLQALEPIGLRRVKLLVTITYTKRGANYGLEFSDKTVTARELDQEWVVKVH
jgi:hypothetical protein